MQDTELYNALLGLRHPWRVREVKLDLAGDRVDVWVEESARAVWECPECGKKALLYDHAQERVWRHLNPCHCQTYLHARLVRVKCPEHGLRQAAAYARLPGKISRIGWLSPKTQFNSSLIESWGSNTEQTQAQSGSEPNQN